MYRIYARPQDRLAQMLLSRFGRKLGADFWALRHVSFEVQPGERLGVIGRNGSGKSTLLEMIAGTLTPTEGEVTVRGRIAALLELGSGFNPDFTGRENVMLSAAILGLSRREIDERFDAIAGFADIGAFLDQPVKLYSSGMFVRLAFAVGTSVDADILLIDEALAVGDIFFRQKCYRRLEALRERGVAVILVTHGMGEVEEFCDRTLLLDRGQATFFGPAIEGVKRYYMLADQQRLAAVDAEIAAQTIDDSIPALPSAWPDDAMLSVVGTAAQVTDGWARCTRVGLTDERGHACGVFEQGQLAVFWYEFELLRAIDVPFAGVVIHSDKGTIVHGKSTLEVEGDVPKGLPPGTRLRGRQEIGLELAAGEYTFEVGFGMLDARGFGRRNLVTHQELSEHVLRLCEVPIAGQFTVIFRPPQHPAQLLHHGVANLRGGIRLIAVAPAPLPGEPA